jgi:hypothetical protein
MAASQCFDSNRGVTVLFCGYAGAVLSGSAADHGAGVSSCDSREMLGRRDKGLDHGIGHFMLFEPGE